MGQMRDSDWSRRNVLRSDWLLPNVAMCTTDVKRGVSLLIFKLAPRPLIESDSYLIIFGKKAALIRERRLIDHLR